MTCNFSNRSIVNNYTAFCYSAKVVGVGTILGDLHTFGSHGKRECVASSKAEILHEIGHSYSAIAKPSQQACAILESLVTVSVRRIKLCKGKGACE
jgi:hypothetical protein